MQAYRIALYLLAAAFIVAASPIFMHNMAWLLNPASIGDLVSGQWPVVLIWIIFFSIFGLFLAWPRQRGKWRKYSGMYAAYIVALFTEMFGFPLTLYLLSTLLPYSPAASPPPYGVMNFSFLGVKYILLSSSVIAGAVSLLGGLLVVLGWSRIMKAETLITGGIYRYSRHPQYLGMSMIILAWMFAWPTIPTILMGAVLLVIYYRLGKTEEKELGQEFGEPYRRYAAETPAYF